ALVEAPARNDSRRPPLLRRRDRAMLEILYGAGLRVSELCALDLDDLDRDRFPGAAVIQVRAGKGGKDRVVPIGSAAVAATDQYLAVRPQFRDPKSGAQHPTALF